MTLVPWQLLGNHMKNRSAEKSISRWNEIQPHQFLAKVHTVAIKAAVLVTGKTVGKSAQWWKAAEEDAFSHRMMCWAHCSPMPSFTSRKIKSWDKSCTASKCSHMHTLQQAGTLIILQGQNAKEYCPIKTGSQLSHHLLGYFPNHYTSFLYSLQSEPHCCPCQNVMPRKSSTSTLQMQAGDIGAAARWAVMLKDCSAPAEQSRLNSTEYYSLQSVLSIESILYVTL